VAFNFLNHFFIAATLAKFLNKWRMPAGLNLYFLFLKKHTCQTYTWQSVAKNQVKKIIREVTRVFLLSTGATADLSRRAGSRSLGGLLFLLFS
jgi:hypothetical protein